MTRICHVMSQFVEAFANFYVPLEWACPDPILRRTSCMRIGIPHSPSYRRELCRGLRFDQRWYPTRTHHDDMLKSEVVCAFYRHYFVLLQLIVRWRVKKWFITNKPYCANAIRYTSHASLWCYFIRYSRSINFNIIACYEFNERYVSCVRLVKINSSLLIDYNVFRNKCEINIENSLIWSLRTPFTTLMIVQYR